MDNLTDFISRRAARRRGSLSRVHPVRETFDGKPAWEGVVHVLAWPAIRLRLALMPGHRQSKEARNGGSSPCCIRSGSIRRWKRCGRQSWRSSVRQAERKQPAQIRTLTPGRLPPSGQHRQTTDRSVFARGRNHSASAAPEGNTLVGLLCA